jgi:integration host factor subunit alpha
MYALTKADLIEKVHMELSLPKKVAVSLVESVFELLKTTLSHGERVKISGFGNFEIREKQARKGRNPQTGASIEISARRVVTFRPSQVLRERLNEQQSSAQVVD